MKTEKYTEQIKRLPKLGKQIIAANESGNIIVYQAFNTSISKWAVANQGFGGNVYSFNRMSWIKPGFLWMMYRSGWATKENQETILAITLSLNHFKMILEQATISSFDDTLFPDKQAWINELDKTEVRLQWDPDHDPYGNKLERKAIQIGMKGDLLKKFCSEWVVKIEDVTNFVKEQHQQIIAENLDDLDVPYEEVIHLDDIKIEKRIGVAVNQI